jgi:hypothetical protein
VQEPAKQLEIEYRWANPPLRQSESIVRGIGGKEARSNRVQGSNSSQLKIVLMDPPFRMNESTQVVLKNIKVDGVNYFLILQIMQFMLCSTNILLNENPDLD